MATSGTFTGARGGNSTGPYLTLAWTRAEVDAANNRSRLTLTLRLHSDYSISFSSSKTGVLQGTSFTYTAGFSGTGSKVIKTQDVWVSHNSDGSKTQALSASFNIAINWGGSTVSSLSVSGNAVLDAIPRASTFTISGGTIGSPITVNISRADSSFYHSVVYQIPAGTQKGRWNNVATQHVWTPPLSDSGYITNATSATATISVHTYNSAGVHVGTTSKNFTLSVPSSVVPTISSFNVGLAGSGRDWTLGMFVQNVSKAVSSFSSAGAQGSTITSNKITIRRVSDGGNSQTISGTSGTTPNVLVLSGQYEAIAETTDSRGRTATSRLTFDVNAYQPPSINWFTTYRGTPTTSVTNALKVTWSNMTTNNPATITVTGKAGNTTTTLYTLTNSTAGVVDTTRTYTGQADSQSYTYTITVTDSFGKTASATSKVGTTFVEFTIAKGQGVGIGKVWERGALDVKGYAYIDGHVVSTNGTTEIRLKPVSASYSEIQSNSTTIDFMTPVQFYTGDVTVRNGMSIQNFPAMLWQSRTGTTPIKLQHMRVSFPSVDYTANQVVTFPIAFTGDIITVIANTVNSQSTGIKAAVMEMTKTNCRVYAQNVYKTGANGTTYACTVDLVIIGY